MCKRDKEFLKAESEAHFDKIERDKDGNLINDQCGGCMALLSARDYIRVLECRQRHDIEVAKLREEHIDKQQEYIHILESRGRHAVKFIKLREERIGKQQACITDLQIKLERLEGKKTDIDWFDEHEEDEDDE